MRRDFEAVETALHRLRAYAVMWKWGSDFGVRDARMAMEALEALGRIRERVVSSLPVDQLALKGLEIAPSED